MTCPLLSEDLDHIALRLEFSSDHFQSSFDLPCSDVSSSHFNFKKTDISGLMIHLTDFDWSFLNDITDIDAAVNQFYDTLLVAFDRFIPVFPPCHSPCNRFPSWFTRDIIYDLKYKRELYRKSKISNSFLRLYQELRRKLKKDIASAYCRYISSVEMSVVSSPNRFWGHVANLRKQTRIPATMLSESHRYSDSESIAHAFASHFRRVHDPPSSVSCTSSSDSYLRYVPPLIIEESLVRSAILRLRDTMTAGPDGIPGLFLRKVASQLALPLSILFKLSLHGLLFILNFGKLLV